VDGGIFANNPSLLAIAEAQNDFGKDIRDLAKVRNLCWCGFSKYK